MIINLAVLLSLKLVQEQEKCTPPHFVKSPPHIPKIIKKYTPPPSKFAK